MTGRDEVSELKKRLQALEKKAKIQHPAVKVFWNHGSEFLTCLKFLPEGKRKRILVTGGAGFVGSHLVDKLMIQGHELIVVDNFFTGRKRNVEHWLTHENFELIHHDVVEPLYIEVDQIYHLGKYFQSYFVSATFNKQF